MNANVDRFLNQSKKWKEEMTLLRDIILQIPGLEEDFKWMHPCYTFQGKNVVLIHGFKEYCALLFHKGALLKDAEGILIQQTEHVQSARQVRFTGIEQVKKQQPVIRAYIKEAIGIEKSGEKVALKTTEDYPVPDEFRQVMKDNPEVKRAFKALTPGRQRAYLFYFSRAMQSKTRTFRIKKCLPQILAGKGLND